MSDNPQYRDGDPTAPKLASAHDDADDVQGHRRDQQPGYVSAHDDADDVEGHVYVEPRDDSGTRRDG